MVLHVGENNISAVADSSFCTRVESIVLGCNKAPVVGTSVFVRLPIRHWAGEPMVSDHGVFRYSSNPKCISFPSCETFFNSLFTE